MGDTSSSFLFLVDLRTRFAGGVNGDAEKVDSGKFLNFEMAREMESWRERGRVGIRSDEGLINVLIELLMADLEDLSGNLAAAERNSPAEDCREDRSRFSMGLVSDFQCSKLLLYRWFRLGYWLWCVRSQTNERDTRCD